ncbi:MAG: response regulator [Deltaproteobacteria bacterium]|jgi:signal transduction histidine kinase/DNA-binding response OmpR family regulator|nr:response regulator [Deltaproteobacteria bacterium]
MKIYFKVLSIFVGVITAIILVTMVSSVFFIRNGLESTILSQIEVIGNLGERLVSNEFELLKTKINLLGNRVEMWADEDIDELLESDLQINEEFVGHVVFEGDKISAQAGPTTAPPSVLATRCASMARGEGRVVISTTHWNPNGDLVFYFCAPLTENRLMVSALPGLFFSEMLRNYKIFQTGALYMIDNEGTVIANERLHNVLNRHNYLKSQGNDQESLSLGAFTERMLAGGTGVGRYVLEGKERLGYYTPISGSSMGWILGVSAPIGESPGGRLYQALFSMSLVFWAFGIAASYFVTRFIAKQFKVINEQNKHLSDLNDIAKSASETKTNFLANMSHEMRTPLNAIVGFSELMLNGITKKEERMINLKKIHTAGITLLGIVNDILDISKIESGKFEMVPVEYEIASLINDTVTVNMIRIGGKDITFKVEVDPHIPARLLGDELRIKQICNNFLSNAFKYTREGEVTLALSSALNGEDVWLMISVKDSGIGIKKEDIAKLFSAYNQVDTKSNRMIEGTGLGLSIAKRMAQMMDGTIDVESDYGVGSTFTATIKQRFVSEEAIGKEVAQQLEEFRFQSKKNALSGRLDIRKLPYARILIVDDVQTNLDVARGMLKPYGMTIDCVTSGAQAVNLIRSEKEKYDAILMDHMMPEMDGIEAARIIREEIGTAYAQNIPIIALTANAIMGNEKMFLENGFQAYLSKPVNMNAVNRVLEQWVRDPEREKLYEEGEIREIYPEENTDLASGEILNEDRIEGVDLDIGLERFGYDLETYQGALRTYAVNTNQLLDKVAEVPSNGSLKNYIIIVHGVKSSSYGIGATEVGKLAEELETKGNSGDMAFLNERNPVFIETAREVTGAILAYLAERAKEENGGKPILDNPDPKLVDDLVKACESYDMDGIDEAVANLDKHVYQNFPDLVAWVNEKVELMELDKIVERFSSPA